MTDKSNILLTEGRKPVKMIKNNATIGVKPKPMPKPRSGMPLENGVQPTKMVKPVNTRGVKVEFRQTPNFTEKGNIPKPIIKPKK